MEWLIVLEGWEVMGGKAHSFGRMGGDGYKVIEEHARWEVMGTRLSRNMRDVSMNNELKHSKKQFK